MNKDKQIEEMAKILCGMENGCEECMFNKALCYERHDAEALYNAGYRKASEIFEEIFEEIENAHEECIHIDPTTNIGYLLQSKFEHKLAELKKKYTEEEG